MKTYDGLFIFPSSLKDENVESVLKNIEGEVTKLQGKVRGTQRLGVRTFSRPLKKMEAGHYVRLALDLEAKDVAALLGRLKLNENIFRLQITRAIEKKPTNQAAAKKEEEGAADGQS